MNLHHPTFQDFVTPLVVSGGVLVVVVAVVAVVVVWWACGGGRRGNVSGEGMNGEEADDLDDDEFVKPRKNSYEEIVYEIGGGGHLYTEIPDT